MRWITIVFVVWLGTISAGAQQVIEKHIDFSGKESVKLNIQIADSINLNTWDKNEVYIMASVNINDNKDNGAYITTFDNSGKSIVVEAKFRDKYFEKGNGCCNKSNIFWKVNIPKNAEFSIGTINANITISGQPGEMKVKTISGFIDLSASAKRDADIDFSTISGTIYSDQNLISNRTQTGLPVKIIGKLNNGGSQMRLETISGDIYFRKSELN